MQRMGNKVPNRMNRLASVKARAILHTCLGMKQRGSILIAFDSEGEKNARPLAEAAAKRKGFLVTEYRISKDNQDERPLEDLAAQMKENDVTVFCVNPTRAHLLLVKERELPSSPKISWRPHHRAT